MNPGERHQANHISEFTEVAVARALPSYFTNTRKLARVTMQENFLKDSMGFINNLSEIAVKPVAITRKNSLFSDSMAGAKASAIVFSIVGTVMANHLDAYKYLEYIFRQLPNLDFEQDASLLDEYMPWSEKVQQKAE